MALEHPEAPRGRAHHGWTRLPGPERHRQRCPISRRGPRSQGSIPAASGVVCCSWPALGPLATSASSVRNLPCRGYPYRKKISIPKTAPVFSGAPDALEQSGVTTSGPATTPTLPSLSTSLPPGSLGLRSPLPTSSAPPPPDPAPPSCIPTPIQDWNAISTRPPARTRTCTITLQSLSLSTRSRSMQPTRNARTHGWMLKNPLLVRYRLQTHLLVATPLLPDRALSYPASAEDEDVHLEPAAPDSIKIRAHIVACASVLCITCPPRLEASSPVVARPLRNGNAPLPYTPSACAWSHS